MPLDFTPGRESQSERRKEALKALNIKGKLDENETQLKNGFERVQIKLSLLADPNFAVNQ